MDTAYNVKQKHRRQEANSLKCRQRRKEGSIIKKTKICFRFSHLSLENQRLGVINAFQSSKDPYSKECLELPSYDQQIAMISDDIDEGCKSFSSYQDKIRFSSIIVKEFSDEEENNVNYLANWLKTYERLQITPLNIWCTDWASMQYECYSTEPAVDESVYNDLKQEFTYASVDILMYIIRCLGSFPYYYFRDENEHFFHEAENYKRQHTLTKEQLLRSSNICKKILNRSSYGVLFLQDNKYFTVTNAYCQHKKSAIKGHPTLKSNGQWEAPWETAVRETEEEIQYRIDENHDWRTYNLDEHQQEYQYLNYLKCLVKDYENNVCNRLIGLFVIRLKTSIEFRPNSKKISDCGWHSIEETYDSSMLYTLHPFITYIQNHQELYNN